MPDLRKESYEKETKRELRLPWKTSVILIIAFSYCWFYRYDERTKAFLRSFFWKVVSFAFALLPF